MRKMIISVIILSLVMLLGCNLQFAGGAKGVNFSDLLKPMQKSSIMITYQKADSGQLPVGASKIGGKPDLPSDFEWYYYSGESYDGVLENRPLSFLAQINCEEAKQFDKDALLPSHGMLYFFYELATMTWGFDPNDKGSARVYYYAGDVTELRRTDFPPELLDVYILPEIPVSFSSNAELPDFEEFIEWHDEIEYDQWDAYDEVKNELVEEVDEETIHKLLGYANLIQGGMLLSCEEATNGIYTGSTVEIPEEELEQYKENCTDWQLLFQFDSIVTGEYEMLWGDLGRIYFYIKTEDLLKLNFDNCWLILQCY